MEKSEDIVTNIEKTKSEFGYDDAVELTGHGRYNYLQLTACSVITNAVAVDMFGFSVVVAAATCDLELDITLTGLLASVPFAGLIFAYPWGFYADVKGRRRALLLSTSVGFFMSALSSFAPSWQFMFVLKFLSSVFSTASFTLTMTYLGECTGSKHRSRYLFIMNTANLGAEIVFFGLAYFLLPLNFNLPVPFLSIKFRPWRLYSFILAVPLGLGFLLMLPLKESPKFLASRGDKECALQVLRDMFARNKGTNEEYQVKSLSDEGVEQVKDEPFWTSIISHLIPLFKPPLVCRTIQLFYLTAICCSINNIFIVWYPVMVNLFFNSISDGDNDSKSFCQRIVSNLTGPVEITDVRAPCNDTISLNTIYAGVILGVVFTTLNLIAAKFATWRRLVLIATYTLSATCLVLVEYIKEPVLNLIVFTLVQSTAIGIGSVASYFVDLYPTAYRGLATSMGMMVSRLVALGGINIVGAAITHHCTLTFYCCTAIVCSGILAALFLPADGKATSK